VDTPARALGRASLPRFEPIFCKHVYQVDHLINVEGRWNMFRALRAACALWSARPEVGQPLPVPPPAVALLVPPCTSCMHLRGRARVLISCRVCDDYLTIWDPTQIVTLVADRDQLTGIAVVNEVGAWLAA
jgi:hypothetical protein